MSQLLEVHPSNPQPRVIAQAVALIESGGIVAAPTDSGYALVARLDDKDAAEQLRRLRHLDARHHLTIMCRDLSDISLYARVDNAQYRLLKLATPGPWTFILQASREVPKRVSHPSRKTIGIRVSEHPVMRALLSESTNALLSTSLILPGIDDPLTDPDEVLAQLGKRVAAVVDAGSCPWDPTTVVDLSGGTPEVLRRGSADPASIGLE